MVTRQELKTMTIPRFGKSVPPRNMCGFAALGAEEHGSHGLLCFFQENFGSVMPYSCLRKIFCVPT